MADKHKALKEPCKFCPYRQDVPSGVWAAEEYQKLPGYDGEIIDQFENGGHGLFLCHEKNGCLCTGWLACHGAENLLAIRLHGRFVSEQVFDIDPKTPVFSSGAEAALHGLKGVPAPDEKARRAIDILEKKRDRAIRQREA